MTLYLRILCILIVASGAFASGMSNARQSWNPVGSTDMRWTVFKLYNITLLTSSGEYQADQYPQALQIRYYRDIDADDLVKATGDQWTKLGITPDKQAEWLAELLTLWPDVKASDTLRIEVEASGANTFFFNDAPIGSVGSKEFSQAFLGIWLSPETSRPDLRDKLIGGRPENA